MSLYSTIKDIWLTPGQKVMGKLAAFIFTITIAPVTIAGSNTTLPITQADNDEHGFDPALFRGSRFSQSAIARLSKPGAIIPGSYKTDVYLNGQYIERHDILFKETPEGDIQPCLTPEVLKATKIKIREDKKALIKQDKECQLFTQLVSNGSSEMDTASLRLDLSVPQDQILKLPRGYVSPDALDSGSTLGFLNYIGNYYHVSYSDNNISERDSVWIALNGGINLGKWQFRQLTNYSYDSHAGGDWNIIRSYIQRPLPAFGSQLQLGELVTSGQFFSGLSFNGLSLATDERMKPDSLRGYAPVVRGIAATNARISISQNGQEIYQTTVSPGAFEINDLYPTSYSGDLDVTVTEANGEVTRFSVPFAAVPESMRTGTHRYNLAMGKTRDGGKDSPFTDFVWQQGLSNTITANGGIRIADGYQAAMFGGVYGGFPGALGFDLTWSQANLPNDEKSRGWMTHLSWSKTFQTTGTTVSLAGYRYSTAGYRDLSDVLGVRDAARRGYNWQSGTYQQQSRFELSLSQSMAEYGNIFLSGSSQDYRNGRSRDTQLQLGYSNSFSTGVSMNATLSRQKTGGYHNAEGSMQTMASLSLSIPLGSPRARRSIMTSSWTHSSGEGNQYQSSVSGMADEKLTTSYSLNASYDQHNRQTVIGGNLQKRMPVTTLGLNASKGDDYWQTSGSIQGGLAIHSGGITAGPYLSDTFALIEAKGAAGAGLFSSQQITINNQGYALLPSMTPYRFNRITLDPAGMNEDSELIDSEHNVAPVAGAGVKVTFRTRSGKALLIKSTLQNGLPVPAGADVLEENGGIVGMVGQGGQIYVRSEQSSGKLIIRWGEGLGDRCLLPFDITKLPTDRHLIRLTSTCTG